MPEKEFPAVPINEIITEDNLRSWYSDLQAIGNVAYELHTNIYSAEVVRSLAPGDVRAALSVTLKGQISAIFSTTKAMRDTLVEFIPLVHTAEELDRQSAEG